MAGPLPSSSTPAHNRPSISAGIAVLMDLPFEKHAGGARPARVGFFSVRLHNR